MKRKRKRASFHQGVTCLQKEFFKARGATPLFILFPNREMNKNTSKKGRVALKRKRASQRLGMKSLKIKKVLINSSQAPSKTSRI